MGCLIILFCTIGFLRSKNMPQKNPAAINKFLKAIVPGNAHTINKIDGKKNAPFSKIIPRYLNKFLWLIYLITLFWLDIVNIEVALKIRTGQ